MPVPFFLSIADQLKQCGATRNLSKGKQLHEQIIAKNLKEDVFLCNWLVQMYGNCGSLAEARDVFDSIRRPNVYSFNLLIAAYIRNGFLQEARNVFDGMMDRDVVSWNEMIAAYVHTGDLLEAGILFDEMPGRNVVSWTTILSGYGNENMVGKAEKIFRSMPEPNISSWNSMIAAYAQLKDLSKCLSTFSSIPARNVVSWNTMITAFFGHGKSQEAADVFNTMPERDVFSWNAMISGYAQNGDVLRARRAFDELPEKNPVSWCAMLVTYTQQGLLEDGKRIFDATPQPDDSSFNVMIMAYAEKGELENAEKMFERMPRHSVMTWNLMLEAYMLNGRMSEAGSLFKRMKEINQVSWNTMIGGYAQNERPEQALRCFCLMDLEGGSPDQYTFVSVLKACSSCGCFHEGKIIHADVNAKGFDSHVLVATALVNFYGKCGELQRACIVFDSIPPPYRDIVMWNAMITICSASKRSEKEPDFSKPSPFQLFQSLNQCGVTPDDITFLGVLTECGHSGLVEDGCSYFVSIQQDFFQPHTTCQYVCMIDLLGRAGWLDEAREFLSLMSKAGTSDEQLALAWRAVASACKLHGDGDRAADASKNLEKLEPEVPSSYVMLSDSYIQR